MVKKLIVNWQLFLIECITLDYFCKALYFVFKLYMHPKCLQKIIIIITNNYNWKYTSTGWLQKSRKRAPWFFPEYFLISMIYITNYTRVTKFLRNILIFFLFKWKYISKLCMQLCNILNKFAMNILIFWQEWRISFLVNQKDPGVLNGLGKILKVCIYLYIYS